MFVELWRVLLVRSAGISRLGLRDIFGLDLSIDTRGRTGGEVFRGERSDRVDVDLFLLCQGLRNDPEFVFGKPESGSPTLLSS